MVKKFKFGILMLVLLAFGCRNKSLPGVENQFRIIGYYSSTTIPVDSFEIEKLTHLIFCFGRLEGNRLHINNAVDSATIKRMVKLKSRNPKMKVMLSLGGWGGCKTCSDVFNTKNGIEEFA